MAFIPTSFFIVLGITAISISQGYVTREMRSLSEKNLRRVEGSVDLFFTEADSLALGLSTDPELVHAIKSAMNAPFATLPDLRSFKTMQSSIATMVNARPYLHSILVSMSNPEGLELSSSEGFVRPRDSEDPEWLSYAAGHESDIFEWTAVRTVAPFDTLELRYRLVSIYRNLLSGAGLFEREGVLAVNVDLSYLSRFLEEQSAGTGGRFLLADRSSGAMVAGDEALSPCVGRLLELFPSGSRAEGPRNFDAGVESGRYAVVSAPSSRLPFTYFLLVPESEFNRVGRRIAAIAAIFALVSLIAGATLTVASARSNFHLLEGIIAITEAAGSGKSLPRLRESRDEALNYVSFSVLKTFVEHDYYKLRMRALELTALQAQMNPHFLFNTLATINGKALALAKGPSDLSAMVELLSSLLDYALADPGRPVTIGDEIDHAEAYFEIQRLRFGERLRSEWDAGEEARSCPCLKLLVQPLVENAIEHGIGHKPEGGLVRVSARLEGGRASVLVEDDGEGISPERLAEIESLIASEGPAPESVGLVNTAKRLALAYGEEASCSVFSSPGSGARIELGFPASAPQPTPSPAPGRGGTPEGSIRSIS